MSQKKLIKKIVGLLLSLMMVLILASAIGGEVYAISPTAPNGYSYYCGEDDTAGDFAYVWAKRVGAVTFESSDGIKYTIDVFETCHAKDDGTRTLDIASERVVLRPDDGAYSAFPFNDALEELPTCSSKDLDGEKFLGLSRVGGSSNGPCDHVFETVLIKSPTIDEDGVEADVCQKCGLRKNDRPVSSFGLAIEQWIKMIKNAPLNSTLVLDMGNWNSLPNAVMAAISERPDLNIKLQFKYEHIKYEVNIASGTKIDLSEEWYGPSKLRDPSMNFTWKVME